MYEELFFHGIPVIFHEDLCLIHTLKVKEVLTMGRHTYSKYVSMLTIYPMDLKEEFKKKGMEDYDATPLEYLLKNAENSQTFFLDLHKAFYTFLQEDVTFLYHKKQIIIGDVAERKILDESNFLEFQNIIREQNRLPVMAPPPKDENERMKEFRLKKESRDYWKRKQKEKDVSNDKVKKFVTLEAALCAYGVGITPFNVGDLTIFAFYEMLDMCRGREHYNNDFDILLNSANPNNKKLNYWIQDNNNE